MQSKHIATDEHIQQEDPIVNWFELTGFTDDNYHQDGVYGRYDSGKIVDCDGYPITDHLHEIQPYL